MFIECFYTMTDLINLSFLDVGIDLCRQTCWVALSANTNIIKKTSNPLTLLFVGNFQNFSSFPSDGWNPSDFRAGRPNNLGPGLVLQVFSAMFKQHKPGTRIFTYLIIRSSLLNPKKLLIWSASHNRKSIIFVGLFDPISAQSQNRPRKDLVKTFGKN